jgi:hypothetical protein
MPLNSKQQIRRSTMGRTRILAGLGVVALVLVVVQAAWGTIPSPSGTIIGCYQKSTGALRVVNSSSSCNLGIEGVLQWNDSPAALNVSVPMGTSMAYVTAYSNHGLKIQYQCWSLPSGDVGILRFDPGSEGQNTLSWMQVQTPFTQPNSQFLTLHPVELGGGSPHLDGGNYQAAGTYVAQTSLTEVTVVFAITLDFTAQTCNFRGTITPGG